MLLPRQQFFISQALWPTLYQIRGSRRPVSPALRNECKLMQNRIRRHSFSLFCGPNATVIFIDRTVSSYLSTPSTMQTQVLTWNVLHLTVGQIQFLQYCRESNVNRQQMLLWPRRVCIWARVSSADVSYILALYTSTACVFTFFFSILGKDRLFVPPWPSLWSRTFFDCLEGGQAFTLPLLLLNNKAEKLHNCLPRCLFELIVF